MHLFDFTFITVVARNKDEPQLFSVLWHRGISVSYMKLELVAAAAP